VKKRRVYQSTVDNGLMSCKVMSLRKIPPRRLYIPFNRKVGIERSTGTYRDALCPSEKPDVDIEMRYI